MPLPTWRLSLWKPYWCWTSGLHGHRSSWSCQDAQCKQCRCCFWQVWQRGEISFAQSSCIALHTCCDASRCSAGGTLVSSRRRFKFSAAKLRPGLAAFTGAALRACAGCHAAGQPAAAPLGMPRVSSTDMPKHSRSMRTDGSSIPPAALLSDPTSHVYVHICMLGCSRWGYRLSCCCAGWDPSCRLHSSCCSSSSGSRVLVVVA